MDNYPRQGNDDKTPDGISNHGFPFLFFLDAIATDIQEGSKNNEEYCGESRQAQ